MKVEDLHTLEITTDFESVVELKSKDSPLCASIGFGTWPHGFETITEAGKAAALFRAAFKMQEALQGVIADWYCQESLFRRTYEEAMPGRKYDSSDRPEWVTLAEQALYLSENIAETVTP